MLAIRDLCVVPPGTADPALRGFSLTLEDGEWIAVTGPNGCGKTSLALAAAGLWPARRGTVEVDGVSLEPTPEGRARARIAAVLQEPTSQLFERTVADEIGFAPRNLGVAEDHVRERVRRWSDRFGLGGLLDRDPRSLSGGLQQLVLLAAALASSPRILVADEGAAHLDAASRDRALEAVAGERSAGLSVLWVTQEAVEVAAADRSIALGPATGPDDADGDGAVDRPETTRADRALGGRSLGARVEVEPTRSPHGPRVHLSRLLAFRVEPCRPVALTGPNGCGKTVTLEAIAGVVPTDQVRVSWDETPALAPVLVSQHPELQVFGDTVLEEIRYGVARRGARVEERLATASKWFAALGLSPDLMRRSPWALSTGERRLVQIVAGIVAPSPLLLLDEPTCGIDSARASILAKILTCVSRVACVIVATQDARLVTSFGAIEVPLSEAVAHVKSQ